MNPYLYLVYFITGAIPAFLVFYGRIGKLWAFAAWLLGFFTASLASILVALVNPKFDSWAVIGEALPFIVSVPWLGIWIAKRQRRYRAQ